MQEIVDKYQRNGTDYLLPIINKVGNEQRQYRNALRLVNNKLKEIAIIVGLQVNLTMYVSRHSWASIAKNKNVPLSVISEGMGHDSEATTQIYLASYLLRRIFLPLFVREGFVGVKILKIAQIKECIGEKINFLYQKT